MVRRILSVPVYDTTRRRAIGAIHFINKSQHANATNEGKERMKFSIIQAIVACIMILGSCYCMRLFIENQATESYHSFPGDMVFALIYAEQIANVIITCHMYQVMVVPSISNNNATRSILFLNQSSHTRHRYSVCLNGFHLFAAYGYKSKSSWSDSRSLH
jgi:hypothetical protein